MIWSENCADEFSSDEQTTSIYAELCLTLALQSLVDNFACKFRYRKLAKYLFLWEDKRMAIDIMREISGGML